jgi:hypothetical protein
MTHHCGVFVQNHAFLTLDLMWSDAMTHMTHDTTFFSHPARDPGSVKCQKSCVIVSLCHCSVLGSFRLKIMSFCIYFKKFKNITIE